MAQSPHERRAAQRFPYHIPVSIRLKDTGVEAVGVTQDVSAKGAFLYADLEAAEGAAVEFTLTLPPEITFAEHMRVRCQGKVLRVVPQEIGPKFGIAVVVERYEFLETTPPVAAEPRASTDDAEETDGRSHPSHAAD
jgi:PilZ domain-containing protein